MKLFKTFAQGIVKYPDRALSHLPRVVDEELKAVCELSKGEEIAYPEKRTWIDMFQKIVDVYPENTAVIDSKGSISYKELDKYSNKIAAYLISLGIKKNDFVAIRMKRVKEFAIAVIGIHKAGAAYVPIDTEYPEDRINYMLEDSEAKTVITEDIVQAIGGHEDVESVNLASYDNYAYMVYTSGSTGRPKGVIQSHNSLYHFACWRVDKLRIKQGGNYGHFNSFAFDGSLDDLISPLVAGATIHIFDEELRRSLIDMDKYIAEHNINGMTTATQFGMELIKYNPKLKLDYLMMGGEKLLPCKNIGFDIINGYGPTEFTVCSSYHVVMGGEENIPIGRPVPNTASYICDRYGNLVPEGVVGEICLAGPQMAEGYWKLPDITKEKFTTIKIGENLVKIYRTGDLGRYNEYGQLEYLGRTDNQVKLRGYRIELSEIDSQAILHPSIKRAVAAVKGDQIVLYYTLNDKETMAEISEKLKEFEGELKEFLAKKLTGYMVPTVYMCIDDIPSTPNGKVDINALPEPVISSSKKYIAPANQYEICIAKCIQDTLGINYQVGAFDNFYELGGDSIKAMRLISVLRKQNINLKIDDITMHNNVRQIAAIAQERVNENAINQEPINGKLQDSAIIGFFRYLDLPEPSLFAQSILLRMNKRANTDKLQQALNVLTKQHDMLRAVWDGEGLYVRNETAVIPIEEYDVLGGNKGDITKLCYKIKTGINMDTALLRVALIHCDSEDLLFMVAHHLIIDGVSWRVLLPDLETAYSQIMAGYAPILDAKTSNYRDYLEAQQAYRNSDGLKNEISYWNGIQQRLMSLDTSDIKDYNRSFEMLSASMEVENTAKVMGADRSKLSLDINDVMITAVARAYCSMAKVRDVSIQLEGHGRENIKEGLELDRTIGWFTSIYPVVISGITVNDNLYEDIVKVKETLHNIPNKGVGYNILRYVDGDERVCYSKDKIAKISFNYLGETSIDANENNMFGMVSDIDTGVVGLNENCFGSDLNINCMVENGRFSLSVSYNKGCYSEGQVRAMADSILEELVKEATYLDSLEGKITTVSDYGENVWTQEEFKIVQADFEGRGEHISGIRPINQELEEMIAQRERNLSRSGYEFVNIYEIDSLPTKDAINKALNRMEELYDVLNAAIVYKDVSVARCVLSDRRLKCTYIDAGNETNQQNYVKILRKELLLQKVDLQRDSLFKLYCVRKDDHSSYLIMAIAPMLCEICGLSDCLLSARFIAFLAGEMGRNFNITDIVNKQCRKEFVRGEHRVCGMYNEYDENKPTLVFMYGIIFQANIQHLLDDWSRKFNMVVFDTVNFHFKELFEGETFDDIVDLYMTLLEFIIPKKDKIFGFIGYSFGGELGFAMAERSSKLRNNKPVVFLGDTDMIPSMSTGAAKENLTMDDLDEYLIEKIKEHDIPQEGMLFAYSMLSYLNSKEKTIKPYDGQTVLLLALKDCSQSAVEVRILLAKKVAKDLKIVEFPKWDHFTLHTDVNLLGTYDKVLDEFI
jgi:bacitracin synthase 3